MKALTMSSAVLLLAVLASTQSEGIENKSAASAEFDVASVRFEQNATDGDAEAVFEAIGNEEGLAKLSITAPDGHIVGEFASNKGTMGIREFHFESPEPTNIAALKKAFPEGEYIFAATTASGAKLEGKSALSHQLPPSTTFVFPKPDARNIPIKNLTISWTPVNGVAGYTLELSPSKSSTHIELQLPPTTTSFAVPEGLLTPGSECQLGIGTVSRAGNVSVIESTFTVADR